MTMPRSNWVKRQRSGKRSPPGTTRNTGSKVDRKHVSAHFRYKNLISIDWRYKLVRRYAASSAAMHDSQKLDKPVLAKLGAGRPRHRQRRCGQRDIKDIAPVRLFFRGQQVQQQRFRARFALAARDVNIARAQTPAAGPMGEDDVAFRRGSPGTAN